MNLKHAIFSKDDSIDLIMFDISLGHVFANCALLNGDLPSFLRELRMYLRAMSVDLME